MIRDLSAASGASGAVAHGEDGRAGAGLSRAFAAPDRLIVLSTLDALGGRGSYDELVAVAGIGRRELRCALKDLEHYGFVERTPGGQPSADLTERGRWAFADHWDALRALRADLAERARSVRGCAC